MQLQIREVMTTKFLKSKQHVIIMGPTGTGKTHLAQAIGHQLCLENHRVRFIRANVFFRLLHASRADQTWEKQFGAFLKPDLLILDDFGLKSLTTEQAEDFYELVAERQTRGSMIITSNRLVDVWVKLFPDPVMANAVLDRVANKAHQIILQGESYRKKIDLK